MARAEVMVGDYVRGGFTKIHLDASMACGDDPAALPVDVIARRSAQLLRVAEAAATEPLAYVIGTEVPVPGGASGLLHELAVTTTDSAHLTIESHRRALSAFGLSQAYTRIVGLVVQPGVEFGTSNIAVYDRSRAVALARVLERQPGLVFEVHSTDYQPAVALKELVEDGFAILKVGPALTFAMREALYGLDEIAAILFGRRADERLSATMERIMVQDHRYWSPYCHGSDIDRHVQRHFSYSDRIRYYWPHPEAVAAIDRLFALLSSTRIPAPLLSQFARPLYEPVVAGRLPDNDPRLLVMAAIQHVLGRYRAACGRV
jgi:D-tagatose-1,6-bisphosphate aldolase subunit GatZ/KbaZ